MAYSIHIGILFGILAIWHQLPLASPAPFAQLEPWDVRLNPPFALTLSDTFKSLVHGTDGSGSWLAIVEVNSVPFSSTSRDNAASWSIPTIFSIMGPTAIPARVIVHIDSMYVIWKSISSNGYIVARSTDAGVSWSTSEPLANPVSVSAQTCAQTEGLTVASQGDGIALVGYICRDSITNMSHVLLWTLKDGVWSNSNSPAFSSTGNLSSLLITPNFAGDFGLKWDERTSSNNTYLAFSKDRGTTWVGPKDFTTELNQGALGQTGPGILYFDSPLWAVAFPTSTGIKYSIMSSIGTWTQPAPASYTGPLNFATMNYSLPSGHLFSRTVTCFRGSCSTREFAIDLKVSGNTTLPVTVSSFSSVAIHPLGYVHALFLYSSGSEYWLKSVAAGPEDPCGSKSCHESCYDNYLKTYYSCSSSMADPETGQCCNTSQVTPVATLLLVLMAYLTRDLF